MHAVTKMAKIRQNRQNHPADFALTNLTKIHQNCQIHEIHRFGEISSNLPFSSLHTFLDISDLRSGKLWFEFALIKENVIRVWESTLTKPTTIQLYSHRNVAVPWFGKYTNVTRFQWRPEFMEDNMISFDVALEYLEKKRKETKPISKQVLWSTNKQDLNQIRDWNLLPWHSFLVWQDKTSLRYCCKTMYKTSPTD